MKKLLYLILSISFLLPPSFALGGNSFTYSDFLFALLYGDIKFVKENINYLPDYQKKQIENIMKKLENNEMNEEIILNNDYNKMVEEVLNGVSKDIKDLNKEKWVIKLDGIEEGKYVAINLDDLPPFVKYKPFSIAETKYCFLHGSVCNNKKEGADKIILKDPVRTITIKEESSDNPNFYFYLNNLDNKIRTEKLVFKNGKIIDKNTGQIKGSYNDEYIFDLNKYKNVVLTIDNIKFDLKPKGESYNTLNKKALYDLIFYASIMDLLPKIYIPELDNYIKVKPYITIDKYYLKIKLGDLLLKQTKISKEPIFEITYNGIILDINKDRILIKNKENGIPVNILDTRTDKIYIKDLIPSLAKSNGIFSIAGYTVGFNPNDVKVDFDYSIEAEEIIKKNYYKDAIVISKVKEEVNKKKKEELEELYSKLSTYKIK